ncbi:MAG: glycosyltransferase family 39 protein, partial [Thermoanaerobaculia bacterium]
MSTLFVDRRSRRAILILTLIILVAAVRTVTTYHVFSATLDEPVHIAAGFDWWRGDLRTDPTHPPLARLLIALPLVSLGVPGSARPDYLHRGNDLLYHDDRYVWHLSLARSANLLFLALSIVVVALWTARAIGLVAGIVAAALFSLLPPVLGHAGMATTDLAAAATWGLAMLVLERFQADPSRRKGVMLGAAVGLGVLSKFSFIPFFVIGAV